MPASKSTLLATSTELADSAFATAIAVDSVLVENNSVTSTGSDGIRLGVGAGRVGPSAIVNNRMASVNKTALDVMDAISAEYNNYCSGNTDDGNATTSNLCSGSRPAVTGSTLTCSS